MPKPKDHVKKHLDKNKVKWDDLPESTQVMLNTFSEAELNHMDALGQNFEDEHVAPDLRICATH
jgi:hypothetical protein